MTLTSQTDESSQQQEHNLENAQNLLRATLDSTLDMIQVFEAVRDETGVIIDFVWILNNHTSENMYGDVVGKSLLQTQPGVVQEGIFEAFRQVVETGQPQQYEKHYVHEQFDGWFYQSVVKLNDGVATTTADITQRKGAEQQLQHNQAFLQSVIDSSLDVIQIFRAVRDDAGRILDFVWVMNNQKAVVQNGQVIGKSLLELNPGVVTTGIFEHMVRVAQTGVAYEHEQYYHHEQFDGWFYQALVKTDDGVAMTTRDITRQKRAEQEVLRLKDEAVQQVTDKYRTLFNTIDEGYCIAEVQLNENGKVNDLIFREINRAWEEKTGIPLPLNRPVSKLLPNLEEHWLPYYEEVFKTGIPIRRESYMQDVERWFSAHYSLVGELGSPLIAAIFDDITERKQQEEVLRISEEKYRTLFNSMDEIFQINELIYDEQGKIIDYRYIETNHTFEKVTGLKNVAGKLGSELGLKIEEKWYDVADKVARTGEAVRFEEYNKLLDSWWTAFIYKVSDAGTRIAVLSSDITERKHREQQQAFLLKLSDALRPLSDPTEIQQVAMQLLGQRLGVNRAQYYMADETGEYLSSGGGYTDGVPAAIGRFHLIEFGQYAYDGFHAGRTQVVTDATTDPRITETVLTSYKEVGFLAYIGVPFVQRGRLIGTVAVHQSAPRQWTDNERIMVEETAERAGIAVESARAEKALRQSQKRFESIANLVPDLLWDSEPEGSTNWYNDRWLQYTGQTFAEAIGWGWTDAIHPDDREGSAKRYSEAVETGKPLRQDHRIRRHDGEYRWFVVSASPVKDKNDRVIKMYCAATDIHDIKRLETGLLEADRRKDEFLAMLAHELRNPISTLRNGLSVLRITHRTDSEVSELVRMMDNQTTHLVRMIDDLLDVSRVSHGKIELQLEQLELGKLIENTIKAIRPQYESRGKHLHIPLTFPKLLVQADATRLSQVVTNLLTNSLRYTGDDGRVWVSLETVQNQAVIRVKDNGIGLTAEQESSVFDLFVQADNSLGRTQGGVGLGLTLVKRLVEMHGGTVSAKSPGIGWGSEFVIFLPVTELPDQQTDEESEISAQQSALKILLIDDIEDLAKLTSMLLKYRGYHVDVCYSGKSGIEAVEAIKPEVVLCDIGMPGLDGYQTAQQIRKGEWGRKVTLIALSGYGQQNDKQQAKQAGFDGHLTKPVDIDQLQSLLEYLSE